MDIKNRDRIKQLRKAKDLSQKKTVANIAKAHRTYMTTLATPNKNEHYCSFIQSYCLNYSSCNQISLSDILNRKMECKRGIIKTRLIDYEKSNRLFLNKVYLGTTTKQREI